MHYLRQGKEFYRSTLALMLPLILQNLVTNLMQLADTFMVGLCGERELAAVSAANSAFFVVMLIIFGLQSGTGVLVSQYYGRGNTDAINRVMGMGYYISLTLTAIVALLAFFFPTQLMKLMTDNAELWEPGAEYARIVGFSYFFMAVSGIYISVQRSMANPRLGAVVLTVSGLLNIALNYVLILGKLGFPALGCAGAAIATLISRGFEVAAVVIYAARCRALPISFRSMLRPGKIIARDFVKFSLPVVLNEGLWSLAMSLYTVIMGHMAGSTAILAAYTISGNIDRMTAVIFMAAGNTAAVVIGREIGCGSEKEVYGKAIALNFMCLCAGVLSSILLLIVRATLLDTWLFPLMGISAEAGGIAKYMLFVVSLLMPIRALNHCNVVGVLRGGGDVRYALACDVLPMYAVCLPSAVLTALVLKLGIFIAYPCFCLDEVIKVIFCGRRILSGKWINNVTRDEIE